MENLEVLVRGLAMQSSPAGLGLPRSVSFQGLELLWVLAVATIVLAVVSVTRVNVVTWGWSNKSGGHLRVRVQSFASLADGAIVTAGGVFSAEIVNCSADSCSEDASSSSDCVSEHAEMLFIFDEKGASLMTTTTTLPSPHPAPRIAALETHSTSELPDVLKFQQQEVAAVSTPQSCGVSFPRREGIEWEASPATAFALSGVTWLSPVWTLPAPQFVRPVAKKNNPSTNWDPLLRLRIRDAVLSNGSPARNSTSIPLAPVPVPGSTTAVTLKDNVVRVWDSDSRELLKSVRLSLDGYCAPATAFDVDWESEVAAMARDGGALSIANLEAGVYSECFQTQQSVVQAIHLGTSSLPKTVFTGGPAGANPGCSVSVWDCRASNRQLSMNLSAAVTTIHGINSHGQELFVRDGASSVAAHDVRKLGASPVSRHPCHVVSHASQDRWWDIDTTFEEADDDEDDDFFDCLTSEETEASGASSYMGRSIVRAMSLNFSTKAPSH